MSRLCSLNRIETQRALAGRYVFGVYCCNKHMNQTEVFSQIPTLEIPFGRSYITLKCATCHKTIELVLNTGIPAAPEMYKAIELKKGDL